VREAGMLLPRDGCRCARGGRHRAGSRTGPAASGAVFGILPGPGPGGAAWQPVTTPTATGSSLGLPTTTDHARSLPAAAPRIVRAQQTIDAASEALVLTEIDHARALKQLGLALSVDEAFGRLPPCAPPPPNMEGWSGAAR
jgi:hypothetical protein